MLHVMISIPICGEETGNELKLQPLNFTQHWSHWRPWGCSTPVWGVLGGQPSLTCLGIWTLKGCHTSTCLGIHQFRGRRRSSRLNLPRNPIFWRPTCLNLPRGSISRRLSHLSLSGDLHPDQGMPGSQAATVLGRISFRKTHL